MLILPLIRRRRRSPKLTQAPAVARLTLVAASVDDGPTATLQFNRAIDVSAMDVTAVTVADAAQGFNYVGYESPIVVDANTVQVLLTGTSEYDGPDTLLTVAAGNGIVGVGGGTWGGCEALELPFG
jgi:hypothetical protein